ncbi:MAG: hypothetical protein WD826_09050 [Actinomycetota bacterium]
MLNIVVRVGAVLAFVVGLGLFALTVTLGDCSAFGGHCPRTGTDNTTDDVLGGGAIGGALMGAGSVFAVRPRLRALGLAAIVATGVAVVCALFAQSMTST